MIKAYTYNLSSSKKDFVLKIVNYYFPNQPTLVQDIKHFLPSIEKRDIVIAFGERAFAAVKNKSPNTIKLPKLEQLDPINGDKKQRDISKKNLEDFVKTVLSIPNQVNDNHLELDEDLPPNLTEIVKKRTKWEGVTENGKTIKVTSEPEQLTADINLTFDELHSIMCLKEAFRVKELEIVERNNSI